GVPRQVTEHGTAVAPFSQQLLPPQVRHSLGMSAGVAAYQVATLVELLDLLGIQKTRLADQIRGHKKVASPAKLFEFGRGIGVRTRFSVVKRKEHILRAERHLVHSPRRIWTQPLCDRRETLLEGMQSQGVHDRLAPRIGET